MVLQVGWFGNKELAAYRANTDHLQRMRMCHTARGSASINATTMTNLHSAVSAGRLQLLEDFEVASSSQQGHRLCLSLRHRTCHARKHAAAAHAELECVKGASSETCAKLVETIAREKYTILLALTVLPGF